MVILKKLTKKSEINDENGMLREKTILESDKELRFFSAV